MKHYALPILVCGIAFTSPALAQDGDEFTGPRVEAVIGYDIVELSTDVTTGVEYEGSAEDFTYGIALGYDYQVNDVVFGIEAEIMDSSLGYSERVDGMFDGYALDGTASLNAGHDLYIGARIGFAFSDRAMLYAKGGYTRANAEFAAVGTVDGVPDSLTADMTFDGFRVGGGMEARLTDNVILKAEYRYSAYSGGDLDVDELDLDLDADEVFDYIDLDRHQVVAGIGYRF